MGDLSSEPSMEEILSSIKRIIAEEGDATPGRPRRPMRAAPPAPPAPEETDEVLELRDPIVSEPAPAPTPPIAPEPVAAAPASAPAEAPPASAPEPIVSQHTAEATRDALGHLSRLLIKPEPNTDGTLEGLVREMLRPVLREWLDAQLPGIVEQMVAREIAKITGGVR